MPSSFTTSTSTMIHLSKRDKSTLFVFICFSVVCILLSNGQCCTEAIHHNPSSSSSSSANAPKRRPNASTSITTTTRTPKPFWLGKLMQQYHDDNEKKKTTMSKRWWWQQHNTVSLFRIVRNNNKRSDGQPKWYSQNPIQLIQRYNGTIQRIIHLFVFYACTKNSMISIFDDQWEAERDPDSFFSQRGIWHHGERTVVKRRTVQASIMRKYAGVGYTPRYVCMYVCVCVGLFGCPLWTQKHTQIVNSRIKGLFE
jgi:hypothetical protein